MKEYKTRKLNRLKEYDYSLNGYYYITGCTHNRQEIFGVIGSDEIEINQLNNISFVWQRSFHDHIIRTTHSLKNIREYIINNPRTWDNDENNIVNYSIKGKACLAPTGQL